MKIKINNKLLIEKNLKKWYNIPNKRLSISKEVKYA